MVCDCFTNTRKPIPPAINTAITAPMAHKRLCRRTSLGEATTNGFSKSASLITSRPEPPVAGPALSSSGIPTRLGLVISPVFSATFCSITASKLSGANVSIGSGNGTFSAIAASARPNSSAVNRSVASGRPARSSGAAIGPKSADTGSSFPTRAASVIPAVSPKNGTTPVIVSSNVSASEYTSLCSVGCSPLAISGAA